MDMYPIEAIDLIREGNNVVVRVYVDNVPYVVIREPIAEVMNGAVTATGIDSTVHHLRDYNAHIARSLDSI